MDNDVRMLSKRWTVKTPLVKTSNQTHPLPKMLADTSLLTHPLLIESVRTVVSVCVAFLAAYLGFRQACRRNDRDVRRIVEEKTTLLENKLTNLTRSEIVTLHRESIEDLQPDVVRALLTLHGFKKQVAQKAWVEYKNLHPEIYQDEVLFAQLATHCHEHEGVPTSHEQRTTATEALARALDDLKQAFV